MVEKIDKPLFQEIQQFRQKWLWFILLLAVGSLIFSVIEQPIVTGILLAILLAGLIYLFYAMKLITEIREDGLYVRFFPFTRQKRIAFEEISSCEARVYHPIIEYGGWGIRYGKRGKAYNVSGNQGVQLEFAQDKPLLIGSQRADELAEAINSMR